MKKLTLVFIALFTVEAISSLLVEMKLTLQKKMEEMSDDMEDAADDVEECYGRCSTTWKTQKWVPKKVHNYNLMKRSLILAIIARNPTLYKLS
jgi:predicted Holliday junction resolvase-like endonuclease